MDIIQHWSLRLRFVFQSDTETKTFDDELMSVLAD